MDFLDSPTLTGNSVTLELLGAHHTVELAEAVQDGNLHQLWYARVPSPENMEAVVSQRVANHAKGVEVPWVIRRNSDSAVLGLTTFMSIRPDHRRLEIGATWLRAEAQGRNVNTEVKLLLLTRAFESLSCIAVEFRTHWHNRRSRAAIAALGAKQDGVLRNHDLWRDGTMRDVVVFSIIDGEWPTVKLGLQEKLSTPSQPRF